MPYAILGPTASGKSALAAEVARRLGGAVVNGDPFQSLAGLAIGTGQPGPEERGGVEHLGYGLLPLNARLNPADFGSQVRAWLEACERPVLVTGSGLYLRGIWNQLDELPEVPEALVDRVRAWKASLGAPALHRYLRAVDPRRASELHPNDASRIVRALALHLATGGRPSILLGGLKRGVPEGWSAMLVLPSREAQRDRVVRRVRSMVEQGWEAETQRAVAAGLGPELRRIRPLGYLEWMEGGDPRALEAHIVRQTQAYAKRQTTFFRNQWPEIPVWDPDRQSVPEALAMLGV